MQKSQTSRGFQCTFGDLAAEQQCRLCTTAGGTAWLVSAAFLPLAALLTLGYGVILLALLQTLQVIDLPALNVSASFAGLPSTHRLGIAVLLGLSERFLNRIGAQAEEVVGTPASQPSTDASAAGQLKTAQIAATVATAAAHPNGHQPPPGDPPTGTTAQPQPTVPVEQPAAPEGSMRRSYTATLNLQGWNSRRANRPTAGVARTNGESPH
jgi:hypothetical protein